ncbi:MAG: Na(+)/H(+) antiporter subunit B, partial [Oceanipulchritudo sp.]
MHWLAELVIYIFLLTSAIVAIEVKDLLAATVTTAAFSFVIAIAFVAMGAVDVGFTEAVV